TGVQPCALPISIPPSMFPTVIEWLGHSGSAGTRGGREAVRTRPCLDAVAAASTACSTRHPRSGSTTTSARAAAQNLLYFRFATPAREPIRKRSYVDSVQITMAEAFGGEGRGRFYDEVGGDPRRPAEPYAAGRGDAGHGATHRVCRRGPTE